MRYCGIILIAILASCKPTQPISTGSYSEDLSVHRPKIVSVAKPDSVETVEETSTPLTGHIKAELDSIVRISIAQNQSGKRVDGFVIQVYTGSSRDRANSVWSQLDSFFPELKPKISYRQPNFQVKAGRFTDRLTAHRNLKLVKEEFPKALLVPERFTLSK